MGVESALVALLQSDDTVSSLLGPRVFPDQAPQSSAYPCAVYTQADRKTVITHDGPTLTDRYGITFEVYGNAKGQARAAAAALRKRLLGYRGDAQGGKVLGVFDTDESDSLDQPLHADERGVFQITTGLSVWYREGA